MALKNTYVEIEKIVLTKEERADHIPEDTKKKPLVMRVKGFLLNDGQLGDMVLIQTITKRIESGILRVERPYFSHSFGHFVEEVMDMKLQILREAGDLDD